MSVASWIWREAWSRMVTKKGGRGASEREKEESASFGDRSKGRSEGRGMNEGCLPAPVSNGTRDKSPHFRVRKSL